MRIVVVGLGPNGAASVEGLPETPVCRCLALREPITARALGQQLRAASVVLVVTDQPTAEAASVAWVRKSVANWPPPVAR